MNNKKIIFGIVLFLAICFLAFTFANPLEQGNGDGTLIQNGGNSTNTNNTDDGKTVKEIVLTNPVKNKLEIGESVNLEYTVSPSTANDKSLTYSSSDTSVIKVDQNGVVTAVGNGTATITVTSSNGKTTSITFTVGEDTTTVADNNTNNNGITVRPTYPVGGNTNNSGSNTGNSGNSGNNNSDNNTGNSGGGTTKPEPTPDVPVTSVKIIKDGFVDKLVVGQTTKISASAEPSNATNKNITFKSSNENVATIDSNGNITAKGPGTAVIIATSSNGITESVTLSVIGNSSSKLDMIKSDGMFTDLKYNTVGNIVKVSGKMSSTQVGFVVTITTPDVLNSSDLDKFSGSVGKNDFGYTNAMNEVMLNADNITNGGYITLYIPINSMVIKRSQRGEGNAQIYYNIDWLGNGHSITYIFDFDGIELTN